MFAPMPGLTDAMLTLHSLMYPFYGAELVEYQVTIQQV